MRENEYDLDGRFIPTMNSFKPYESKNSTGLIGLSAYENGGQGSGNWGHSGRPGEVGGSSPDGSGGVGTKLEKKIRKEVTRWVDMKSFTKKLSPTDKDLDNLQRRYPEFRKDAIKSRKDPRNADDWKSLVKEYEEGDKLHRAAILIHLEDGNYHPEAEALRKGGKLRRYLKRTGTTLNR